VGLDAASRVLDVCDRLLREGLVVGTAGNVSVRTAPGQVLITPSGVPYPALRPDDLVLVDFEGKVLAGSLRPTSELAMHLALYQLGRCVGESVGAVVHTHAPHATAVSTLCQELPPIHYALAGAGGPVRVAEYATFGTPELAAAAAVAMAGRNCCLLAIHGTLAVCADLEAAMERTQVLEWTSQVYLLARAAGSPRVLPPDELDRVAAKLATYGQDHPRPT
jgi:L-fuculose-phosphate aldolase